MLLLGVQLFFSLVVFVVRGALLLLLIDRIGRFPTSLSMETLATALGVAWESFLAKSVSGRTFLRFSQTGVEPPSTSFHLVFGEFILRISHRVSGWIE